MTSIETLKALARVRAMAANGEARAIRTRHNVSLTEMADAIPAAIATLSRWEAGDRRPRGEAALRWLQILDSLEDEAFANVS